MKTKTTPEQKRQAILIAASETLQAILTRSATPKEMETLKASGQLTEAECAPHYWLAISQANRQLQTPIELIYPAMSIGFAESMVKALESAGYLISMYPKATKTKDERMIESCERLSEGLGVLKDTINGHLKGNAI